MIRKLSEYRFDELGSPQIRSDAIPPIFSSAANPHKLLIIPVQYQDRDFDRFADQPDADQLNRNYLQELLFAEDLQQPGLNTMTHYYWHQSKGQYVVTGEVMMPVTVDQPAEYYGKPIQNSDGQWRNDSRPELLVEDALVEAVKANPDFPWEQFDVWDPTDYDSDGELSEPDGYIDHFVLMFAGKAQSSCQGLFNLGQKYTPDAPANLYDTLEPREQECAQRIWPHRFSLTKNNGKGPVIDGVQNNRGGVPLREGLWVYDYNMQSEYTDVSTFIHEFGHSLGLPDVYASRTSNSTASWEMMSSTASPYPQELSTWSRMMLGWSRPCVILPPGAGGDSSQEIHLSTMNNWQNFNGTSATCDAAMIVLPPKIKEIRMGPLQSSNGQNAAYTGQGNDLNHYLSRSFDFTGLENEELSLELDTWFSIEADWDYLYVEVSEDGINYERLMPVDKSDSMDTSSVMPSRRGHDGIGTIPGFTGRSGDLDGDGKVESAEGCDPTAAYLDPEMQMETDAVDYCQQSQWVHAEFDLSSYSGKVIELRFHYFADMAAVEDGALVDNIRVSALDYFEDFEAGFNDWKVEGFSLSGGSHDIAVPHFYLLEYRDPYESFADSANYDSNLAKTGLSFYPDSNSDNIHAVNFRYRPGVLLWYYNGSYLWSQNEPSQFGPGQGFLLLVDSTPQEFQLPGIPMKNYKEEDGWKFYEFDENDQEFLQDAFLQVMCFQRRPDYFPVDLPMEDRERCSAALPPGEQLSFNDRPLLYGYTISNELLPGEARQSVKSMSTLFDYRIANDGIEYRLYDRRLRNAHSADAPFAVDDFAGGMQFLHARENDLQVFDSRSFKAVSQFSDSEPSVYQNPYLPYGSAAIPNAGLRFSLSEPDTTFDDSARVKVMIDWVVPPASQ